MMRQQTFLIPIYHFIHKENFEFNLDALYNKYYLHSYQLYDDSLDVIDPKLNDTGFNDWFFNYNEEYSFVVVIEHGLSRTDFHFRFVDSSFNQNVDVETLNYFN